MFGKERKSNKELNLEEFISVNGITILGNQSTKDKINQVNFLESLPYEAPEEVHADELEVIDEETVSNHSEEKSQAKPSPNDDNDEDLDIDDQGQGTLF